MHFDTLHTNEGTGCGNQGQGDENSTGGGIRKSGK